MTEVKDLKYPDLPPTRTDLGYEWILRDVSAVTGSLCKFLERNNARAFLVDVYASNNQVYRNMIIQLPEYGELAGETIHIQFNRDEGRQYSLKTTK